MQDKIYCYSFMRKAAPVNSILTQVDSQMDLFQTFFYILAIHITCIE